MIPKGDDDRLPFGAGNLFHFLDQGAMPPVDPVEIADGQYKGFPGVFEFFDAFNDFHELSMDSELIDFLQE